MLPFEYFVGLRYTRAKRRNHFISFISMTSMAGIALGVAALIVVLSVMNGFQKELRSRILGVASHVQLAAFEGGLSDWKRIADLAGRNPEVTGAAPYINAQGLLSFDQTVQGALIRGVQPELENRVADIGNSMKKGSLDALKPGGFGIVLGSELARNLGVRMYEKVTVTAPPGQVPAASVMPRIKQFRVVGIFEVGMYEYDSGLALLHLADAQRLYRMEDKVTGVRLKLADLFAAPRVSLQLGQTMPADVFVTDWTRSHANFFRAVQIEKRVMFIILTLIVAVAAFNIVSTLVMAVTDKQPDIAILRTLGASPASIMKIFVIEGHLIGFVGVVMGVVLGLALCLLISQLKIHIAADVYLVDTLRVVVNPLEIVAIVFGALEVAHLATLYPALRAARTYPVEAMRFG